MTYNLIIPCSGPGSRSSSYSKFHKALVRIGRKAVINHIIDSYHDVNKIYVLLGYNGNYIREFLDHCGYENIEYIKVENWQESQFASLKQIPKEVFSQPFYMNSCDNWTTSIPPAINNTAFFCQPENIDYYDTVNGIAFAGIGFVKDGFKFYETLHNSTHSRNDYLIYKELKDLEHVNLTDWYDIGNCESLKVTQDFFDDGIDLLDKNHQEIYYVNNRVVKLFKKPVDNLIDSLTKNLAFPHPEKLRFTACGLSYDFVNGSTNVDGEDFLKLFNNLSRLWDYCLTNNNTTVSNKIWQEKTFERFDEIIKKYPEFSRQIKINGLVVDPIRTIEYIDWKLINNGITGPCHGDLNLDNIIVSDDRIYYIDHREGVVNDIFYDICKFYHSLFLDNKTLKSYQIDQISENEYYVYVSESNNYKKNIFKNSHIYQLFKNKIEIGVGCIWLSMAPLNVDDNLNKFLFLYAIQHLQRNI